MGERILICLLGEWCGTDEGLAGRSQKPWTFPSCLWSSFQVLWGVWSSSLSMTRMTYSLNEVIFQRHSTESVIAWLRAGRKMFWKKGRCCALFFAILLLLALTFRWIQFQSSSHFCHNSVHWKNFRLNFKKRKFWW